MFAVRGRSKRGEVGTANTGARELVHCTRSKDLARIYKSNDDAKCHFCSISPSPSVTATAKKHPRRRRNYFSTVSSTIVNIFAHYQGLYHKFCPPNVRMTISIPPAPEVARFTILLAVLIFHKRLLRALHATLDAIIGQPRTKMPSSNVPTSPVSLQSSSSPRFQTLHRRLRSSISSHGSSPVMPGAANTPSEEPTTDISSKSDATRAAKEVLHKHLRTDWYYESRTENSEIVYPPREILEYRHRQDGSSGRRDTGRLCPYAGINADG